MHQNTPVDRVLHVADRPTDGVRRPWVSELGQRGDNYSMLLTLLGCLETEVNSTCLCSTLMLKDSRC